MLNILNVPKRPDIPTGLSVNVTAQFRLNLDKINITRLAVMADLGLGYNPKRFVASPGRIRVYLPTTRDGFKNEPEHQDVTALLYHTSRVVLTGASNEFVARNSAHLMTFMLHQRLQFPVTMNSFRVENVVSNFFLGYELNLNKFASDEGDLVHYEPDVFPAAIYRAWVGRTVLINRTGKLIITGARDRDESIGYYHKLYDKLLHYREESGVLAIQNGSGSALEVSNIFTAGKHGVVSRYQNMIGSENRFQPSDRDKMLSVYNVLRESFFSEVDIDKVDELDESFGISELRQNITQCLGMDPGLDRRKMLGVDFSSNAIEYLGISEKIEEESEKIELPPVVPIDHVHRKTIRPKMPMVGKRLEETNGFLKSKSKSKTKTKSKPRKRATILIDSKNAKDVVSVRKRRKRNESDNQDVYSGPPVLI